MTDPAKREIVFSLSHTKLTCFADEDRLIGVFAEEAQATRVVERLRTKPGFLDAPDGFVIDAEKLDHDNWPEGFSWEGAASTRGAPDEELLDVLPVDPNPNVYVLYHRRFVGMHECCCHIGIYSTHQNAIAAAQRSSTQEGFRSFPDGYFVLGLSVDTVHWSDGFDEREAYLHRLLSCTIQSYPPTSS